MSVTKEAVIEKLRTVNGPDFTGNVVDLGLVSDIFIADSKVFFSITVPQLRAFLGVLDQHRKQLQQQLSDIEVTLAEIAQHEERCHALLAEAGQPVDS